MFYMGLCIVYVGLCIFYVLHGSVYILGTNADGKNVYLRDIWPSRDEIMEVEHRHVIPAMFKEVYSRIQVFIILNR